jgi:hypothetical protein
MSFHQQGREPSALSNNSEFISSALKHKASKELIGVKRGHGNKKEKIRREIELAPHFLKRIRRIRRTGVARHCSLFINYPSISICLIRPAGLFI